LQPGEALKTRIVGQLRNTSPTAASCLLGPIACARGKNENMGPALPCRKLGKTSETTQLASSPIPTTASLKRLVNSARFDKAGGGTAGSMPSIHHEAFFRARLARLPIHQAGCQPNPAAPIQQSYPSRQASCARGILQIWALRSPEIVQCTRASGDSRENIEFRAFPQCFLNLLETPAP
jgi:hypothetical protein